jgi:hypothetical protein
MGQDLLITNQDHAFNALGIDPVPRTEIHSCWRLSRSKAKNVALFVTEDEPHGGGTEGTFPVKEENGIGGLTILS